MGLQERINVRELPLPLAGKRVLIVEDQPLVAMVAASMIEDLGGEVAPIASNVDDAIVACSRGGISLALLDFFLGGQDSRPVAAALSAAGIRFVLTTGAPAVPADLGHAGLLTKPYTLGDLRRSLAALVD